MAINHDYRGILHVFYDMVRWDGFLSLYRGFIPTLLGIIPYAGTTFFTYETCKRLHHGKQSFLSSLHLNDMLNDYDHDFRMGR